MNPQRRYGTIVGGRRGVSDIEEFQIGRIAAKLTQVPATGIVGGELRHRRGGYAIRSPDCSYGAGSKPAARSSAPESFQAGALGTSSYHPRKTLREQTTTAALFPKTRGGILLELPPFFTQFH